MNFNYQLITIASSIFISSLLAFAQEAPFGKLCKQPWQLGRFDVFQSNQETIGDLVNKDNEWISSVTTINEFVDTLSNKVNKEITETSCVNTKSYYDSAVNKIIQFSLGYESDLEKCVYEIEWDVLEEKQEARTASNIFSALTVFDEKLTEPKVTETLISYDEVNEEDWRNGVNSVSKFDYKDNDKIRECQMFKLVNYRGDNIWYTDARVTNESTTDVVHVDYARIYAGELLYSSGKSEFKSKQIYLNESCDIEGNLTERTGTLFESRWKGKPGLNGFNNDPIEQSKALQKALEKSSFFAELIYDASLASSAAILLVPAILAFFPVSLFQEVNLATSMLYTAATDIVSVIPIFIKGVELYRFGSTKHWSIVSEFVGNTDPEKVAAVQTNIAYCSMKSSVRTRGLVYMLLGLFLMVLGITFEFLAWKYLTRLKYKWMSRSEVPTDERPKEGAGLLWYWSYFKNVERNFENNASF